MNFTPEQIAVLTLKAADDKKAEKSVALDLRGLTVMCDYFVITEAETVIQVRSITQGIIDALEEVGVHYRRREGWEDAVWVLLDYGDVVVHVFRQEEREFYDLEKLWGDAPQLTSEQLTLNTAKES